MNGEKIPKTIIQVWIKAAGFSFPSGHSVSAFLLVTILSYLFADKIKPKNHWVLGVMFLWAIMIAYSRVIIGVHTSLDVTFGAFFGSIIGYLAMRSKFVKRFFLGR